jgi:hypothetical protein
MVALGQELVDWAVRAEVADWAKKKGADISRDLSEPEPRTGEPWGASLANFQQFTDALEQQKAVFRLIGGSGSENQLMVLLNPSAAQVEALSAEYSQCLSEDDKARERRKQRLPVVAVQVMASEEEVSLPQEVVAVLDEADSRSFVARLMGNAPKKVKKRQPLIGWHVFALDPLLENVDRLLDVLEEASYIAVPTPEPSEAE